MQGWNARCSWYLDLTVLEGHGRVKCRWEDQSRAGRECGGATGGEATICRDGVVAPAHHQIMRA